jgi:hypothetical protein
MSKYQWGTIETGMSFTLMASHRFSIHNSEPSLAFGNVDQWARV